MRLWPKSEYVKHLEAEVDRLRGELRTWQEAVMKREGLPSLTAREAKDLPKVKPRMLPSQWRNRIEARHPEKEEKPA